MAEQKRDADGKFGSGGGGSLKSHPMYSDSDHQYLKGKGYTDAEIKSLWDRDHKAGSSPVTHKKAPDIVGYLSGGAKDADPFQPDETAALQGEAGRQARKQARDCMSGRFRP